MVENEDVKLREFLEDKINGLQKYFDIKFNAIEDARKLAYDNLEKRLEGMNELRAQLQSQSSTFITRESFENKHCLIQAQVDSLRLGEANLAGKATQQSVNITMAIALLGLAVGIIAVALQYLK